MGEANSAEMAMASVRMTGHFAISFELKFLQQGSGGLSLFALWLRAGPFVFYSPHTF